MLEKPKKVRNYQLNKNNIKKRKEEKIDVSESIKRLLIAQLIIAGVTTDTIGKILNVDGSTIRKMVPSSELGKAAKKTI